MYQGGGGGEVAGYADFCTAIELCHISPQLHHVPPRVQLPVQSRRANANRCTVETRVRIACFAPNTLPICRLLEALSAKHE